MGRIPMSTIARELVATLNSVGGRLRILEGRVRVEDPAPLPSELIERLRAVKGEVFAVLASREGGQSALSDAAWPTPSKSAPRWRPGACRTAIATHGRGFNASAPSQLIWTYGSARSMTPACSSMAGELMP
jgi:hypothetical protein